MHTGTPIHVPMHEHLCIKAHKHWSAIRWRCARQNSAPKTRFSDVSMYVTANQPVPTNIRTERELQFHHSNQCAQSIFQSHWNLLSFMAHTHTHTVCWECVFGWIDMDYNRLYTYFNVLNKYAGIYMVCADNSQRFFFCCFCRCRRRRFFVCCFGSIYLYYGESERKKGHEN